MATSSCVTACLPPDEREHVHAVAAADYWGKTKLRRFVAEQLLGSVLDRSLVDG